MKRLALAALAALAVVLLIASTPPMLTRTFLVSHTTATEIDATAGRKSFLLQNQGANDEWCQLGGDGGTVTMGAGIDVPASNGSWGMNEPEGWPIYCIAATADQTGDAGTVIIETR